jgi:predicted dehydrogenase
MSLDIEMDRKKIHIGIIGLGLMGKEFACAIARWPYLLTDGPVPVLTGICDKQPESWTWFKDNFPSIRVVSVDYRELLASDEIDAIYCAVPHHLHEPFYTDIIRAGKHLFGEKPFGIDAVANQHILEALAQHPEIVVRCSSEFPYFPACQRLIEWIKEKKYGQLIEVRTGFHHSSDMDLSKTINWKRTVEINGAYGCMGDLGLHTLHIPFRMGWIPESVSADLQNIAETRPDGKGNRVPCNTWDNAVLTCKCTDPATGKKFSMVVETKRMAPGATNNWFIEVYGTEGSAKFSTHNPKAFDYLVTNGKEQGWTRIDLGSQSAIPTITGGIFEFGFSDAFQQMLGAFMNEFSETPEKHPFRNIMPEETAWSHQLFTAALESGRTGKRIGIS